MSLNFVDWDRCGRLAVEPETASAMMIAESNHRIANNLMMIAALSRLQAEEAGRSAGPLKPGEVRLMLQEISARIETVSRLHRLLSGAASGDAPDLGAYLRDVAVTAIESMATVGPTPRLVTDIRGCLLDTGQVLSVGLVVGELISNSVKYAHPAGVAGEVRLRCERDLDGTVLIEVADNGVGFPEGFDPVLDGGLGMRLVHSLAAQLGGALEFEQSELGLSARLSIFPRVLSA
jgi:two-component sensor histidine kinase